MNSEESGSFSWKNYVALFVLVGALFFVYDYHEILPKRPQSVHQWRQCDGTSFALSYARNGLNPFAPAAHNILSKDGRVVAEFPVVYYMDGLLIRVFGNSDLITRLVNILIFFIGLLYLFRISLLINPNPLLALFPVLVLYSLPVMTYYTATAMPNIPAFSLMIAGLYYLGVYYRSGDTKALWKTATLCGIAAMIKSPVLIPYLAFCGALIFQMILGKEQKPLSAKHLFLLSVPLLATAAWIFIARYYNSIYGAEDFFLMATKPLWQLDREFIDIISIRIKTIWIYDYTYLPTLYFLSAVGLGFLILPIRNALPFKAGLILLLLGSIAYFYLFFEQFYHHDYYVIELYFIPVACALILLFLVNHERIPPIAKRGMYIFIAAIVILNIRYTDREMHTRYTVDNQYNNYNDAFFDLAPKLREAGIQREDKLIVVADKSPNISLYMLDQPGWTRFPEGLNEEIIEDYIKKGAKYLICWENDPTDRPYINPYLKELLIEHQTLRVYSL